MIETEAKEFWKKGVELLSAGQTADALQVFEKGLDRTRKAKVKGAFLYNIAVCQVRLGQREAAIETLDKAVTLLPRLGPKFRRDKDFGELRDFESFRSLRRKHRGRYVRTWRWYLAWCLPAAILGVLVSLSTGQDPAWTSGQFSGMAFVLAWFVGKLVEGAFAFKRGLRGEK